MVADRLASAELFVVRRVGHSRLGGCLGSDYRYRGPAQARRSLDVVARGVQPRKDQKPLSPLHLPSRTGEGAPTSWSLDRETDAAIVVR